MIAAAVIIMGFACVATSLTLARLEFAETPRTSRTTDPFGDALSVIVAWMAFAGLVTAALYRFGVVTGVMPGALLVILGRFLTPSTLISPLYPYKLSLAIVGFLSAIAALWGVMTVIEGAFNG